MAAARARPARTAARTPRPRRSSGLHLRLRAWAPRSISPRGWAVTLLVLLGVVALGGSIWSASLAGLGVRALVGYGGVLVAGWCAWLAWLSIRKRAWVTARVAAAGGLSVCWLMTMALREPGGGGVLGQALVDLLEAGFGHAGTLALVSVAAAIAVVVLVGIERVLAGVSMLGRLAVHLVSGSGARRAVRPGPTPVAELPPTPAEPIILGPRRPIEPPPPAPAPRPAAVPKASDVRDWQRPDPALLAVAAHAGVFSPTELKARARIIEETLLSFNVQARVVEVQQGPAITQFGLDPAPGVAVNRIVSRQNDLALRLGAPTLRVLAPVPGRPLVGLEVPNTSVATVKLGDLISAPQFTRARLPIGIGMDVSGKPIVGDLSRMPHLLVAGATGSGKSVCINALITSLLVSRTPDEVNLILVDPKQVELSQYKGLPHLRLPVVTDMDKVVATLRWTVVEMERRYTRFSEVGARNIVAFNDRLPDERLGYLVVVIDELADMMLTAPEEVERLICRLAQLGRAAGVHLVVATQRPSVDVLTGLIKANLPTRIAFATSSQTDSRVILDRAGAERLLGRGDALYQAGDEMNPQRVQGAFVSDDEIEAVCDHWRAQGSSQHSEADEQELAQLARQADPEDKLLNQARQLQAEHGGELSPSYLQRKLRIGAHKAARIHQMLLADEAAARATAATADD